jgi:hypothetical protein
MINMTRIFSQRSRACNVKIRTVRYLPLYMIVGMIAMMISSTAFTPKNSATLTFPSETLANTTLEYKTNIEYTTNQGGLYISKSVINSKQNWTLSSPIELTIWNRYSSNASFGDSTRNTQEFSYKVDTSSSTPQMISGSRPSPLAGPWEHNWPSPNVTERTINAQEISLTYETARYMNLTYHSTTTITLGDDTIPVRLYKGSITFTQGCG